MLIFKILWNSRYFYFSFIIFCCFFLTLSIPVSSHFNNYFQFTHWEWDLFSARNLTNVLYLLKDKLGQNGILICREEIYTKLCRTVILIRSIAVPNIKGQFKMTFKTTMRQKQNKNEIYCLSLLSNGVTEFLTHPFTSVFSYFILFSSENSLHCWKQFFSQSGLNGPYSTLSEKEKDTLSPISYIDLLKRSLFNLLEPHAYSNWLV